MISNAIADLLTNEIVSIRKLAAGGIDGKKDINKACGYPENPTVTDYALMYRREGIGTRVVALYPEETWQITPVVYESEDEGTETVFETAWNETAERTGIWDYLCRIDEVSGIGRYGVLLLGFDDGKDFNEPLDGITDDETPAGATNRRLVYLRVFDESLCQIDKWNEDRTSPRFQKPELYTLKFDIPSNNLPGQTPAQESISVHWTRVLHVADNRKTSEVFGIPRMETVLNRLIDLRKVLGGSGEMYWNGGWPGISVEMDPEALSSDAFDPTKLGDELTEYAAGLKRWLAIAGGKVTTLAPNITSPADAFAVLIKTIAIILNVPYRVFMGSEEAKLAAETDDDSWTARVHLRRMKYAWHFILKPLVVRLIAAGVLPSPAEINVDWNEAKAETPETRIDNAAKMVEAIVKYVSSDAPTLIPPMEFLTVILGFDQDTAESLLAAAEDQIAAGGLLDPEEPEEPEIVLGPDGKPIPPADNPSENLPPPPQESPDDEEPIKPPADG